MRVAYNAILLGSYFSGVEVTISSLARVLARELRKDFHVFLNRSACVRFPFADASCHQVQLSGKNRISRICWEHFSLPGQVEKLGCDLLHCPGYIAPFNTGVPIVLTVHDVIAILHPELCRFSNRLYYRAMLGRSIRRAAQIIVPSTAVKSQLVELYGTDEGKVSVIPFAAAPGFRKVEDRELLEQVKRNYLLPDKFVLSVANQEPKKNISGVIRAFAAFKARFNDYKLVLVGRETWGSENIDGIINGLGLKGDVIRTGYVPIAFLPSIYSLASVFLFPSLDEGFGIPVLEAMACGVPVVCSDRGALPETSGGAALCLPPDDVPGIADALAKFAEDSPMRNDFIQLGFKRAAGLSWEKTAEATLEVYRKAIA